MTEVLGAAKSSQQPRCPTLLLLVTLSGGLLRACEVPSVKHFFLPAAKLTLERTAPDGTWVGLAHAVVTSSRSCLDLSRSHLCEPDGEAPRGTEPAGVAGHCRESSPGRGIRSLHLYQGQLQCQPCLPFPSAPQPSQPRAQAQHEEGPSRQG